MERGGVGDSARAGLREKRDEKPLTDRAVGGAGEAERSRREGLNGMVEEGRDGRATGTEDLRLGLAEEGGL